MKKQTPTDASRDVKLNAVRLPDGSIVTWARAFPLDPVAAGLTTHRDFGTETR